MANFYPLLFEPALKDYVWGGRSLETVLGRTLPPGLTAESWEISAHPNGSSITANGPYKGQSLNALHEVMDIDLVGTNSTWANKRGKFPLLIKLLDASRRLSVQVHPDDQYALLHENGELGKTEMWIILHAEPGGSVILGVNRGTEPDEFKKAAAKGQLDRFLHRLPVQSGDFICVPSGSLHAIMGGLVIAEIQQNSDVTYRVYDWGRNSDSRPLHLKQAMDVINFDQIDAERGKAVSLESSPGQQREMLCSNEYFKVERWFLSEGNLYGGKTDGSTFDIWGVIDGTIKIEGGESSITLPAVNFTLLPASLGKFSVNAASPTTLLRIYS